MSGVLTLAAGQVFTGNTTLAGDTGMIALTEVGTVTFNTAANPPTISSVEITQDGAANSVSTTINGFPAFIQSVTIDSVNTGAMVTLTTADLPPGTSVPPGFTLPQTVTGTTLGVTVATSVGTFTGTAGLYGLSGSLALVAVQSIDVLGFTVNAGAAILSLGTQATGSGLSQTFTPAFGAAPCFAAGTRIRTPAGDVKVEALRAGDVVSLAHGGAAKVAWLGHRDVDCRRHPKPWDVWPVRVRADAFAPGRPIRDLWLSPDHAVAIDGALIPIRFLLNGATIARERADSASYWHVELDAHDVILAEGLPCESYLDTGNRDGFANGGGPVQMHPDFAPRVWETQACAPLVRDGARLAVARRALLRRAKALGHLLTDRPDLRVIADGRAVVAEIAGGVWRVRLPEATRRVRLASRVWTPAEIRPEEDDARCLGVAIARLWLDGREASLESAGLCAGWHAPEARWRWTDGDAVLAVADVRDLAFEVAMSGTYWRDAPRWTKDVEAA